MKKVDFEGLSFYQFDIFPKGSVVHGIFTRKGGISEGSFSSLNVSGSSGDFHENVVENRRRIFSAIERNPKSIFDVWQVHSSRVVFVDEPRGQGEKHIQADAILTRSSNVSLFMQFADCVPIMVYDPEQKIIGTIHAGWQGTVKRIVQETIKYMVENLNSNPENILAGIGPSIGPDHYEVGNNVLEMVNSNLSEFKNDVVSNNNEKFYFNLWEANRLLLQQSGVRQIEVSNLCTACNLGEWYSYRLEGKKSGRFGMLLGLA